MKFADIYASDDLKVMFQPGRTYRQLAELANDQRGSFWCAVRRPLLVMFVLGAFVSFTTAGRLVPLLVLDGMVFWGFVPILQVVILILITRGFVSRAASRAASRARPAARVIDLFFMGHLPWLLWLMAIAGSCLFVPAKQIYLWPVQFGWVIPISLVVLWVWSNVTSFWFFRAALMLNTSRSVAALLVYNVLFWGILISYYFAIDTIQLHRLGF